MLHLEVNNTACDVDAPDDTALIYVLRNDLGLKGTRFGCGKGQCGCCLVLVDGECVESCQTPLWAVVSKAVTTIEGLGTAECPHVLQQAFIDAQAMQCGYCVSGIIIRAAALLVKVSNPSDEAIREALDRNLCRCGAQPRMIAAIRTAARGMSARTTPEAAT